MTITRAITLSLLLRSFMKVMPVTFDNDFAVLGELWPLAYVKQKIDTPVLYFGLWLHNKISDIVMIVKFMLRVGVIYRNH